MNFDVPGEVITTIFDNGYEEQILDIVEELENDTSRELSDIPISPITMKTNDMEVVLAPEVYTQYKNLVELISNPDTAEEIPYFLLGNKKLINNKAVVYIEKIEYCKSNDLNDLRVRIDEDRFKELLENENYKIISIGHTHGNVSEDKKESSLVRNLSDELIDKYQLRDIGLNLSVSDIWQHEVFKCIARTHPEKEIYQTVIMYNGDIVMITGNNIKKHQDVGALGLEGEIEYLPTGNGLFRPKNKIM